MKQSKNKAKGNCGYITQEQKKELIAFMEQFPELKSGKFTANFTCKRAQELWMQLREKLNALPGANKDWKQWRKTWQDMKSKTKKKKTEIKNHRMGTGGGPETPAVLDSDDEKIIQIIGPVLLDGDPVIQESASQFSFIDKEVVIENIEKESKNQSSNFDCHDVAAPTPKSSSAECSQGSTETIKKPAPTKLQRLQKTVEANDKLLQLTEQQNVMYKRNVEANESKAESLKLIAESFKLLVDHFIYKEA